MRRLARLVRVQDFGATGDQPWKPIDTLIDARVLAECLSRDVDPRTALGEYEAQRREATSRVVLTNRSTPPDIINIRVEELTGDRPFSDLSQFITQAELKALSDNYKRIAGFDISAVNDSP